VEELLPPARPEVIAYNNTWYALYFVRTGWSLLGLALLLRLGISARIRSFAERKTGIGLLRVALYFALYSLLLLLWMLPLSLTGYLIERGYGFATLTPMTWLLDRGRSYLLGLVYIPIIWLGYLLLRRSPKRWWLWLWAGLIPVSFFITILYPIVADPLFNRFQPLSDSPIRRSLRSLAQRAGIGEAQIYEVNMSARTTKLNAYVTGIGPTKRIVLWDTTLKSLPEDEILAIMAHEIGHYVLRHVWWGLSLGIAGGFAILWLLSRLYPWAVGRFGARAGIRDIHDIAGLPLFMLILSLLLFLQTPVESAISRYMEHQADRYGIELSRMNEASARAFVSLHKRNYSDPDPPRLFVYWFYSHPPVRERVAFALRYRPSP
jgi:Zn-dependent protease with chaperone function